MSYSQIKKVLGVSKSTLSSWLSKYPLSKKRINELRGNNERRIEKFRNTMKIKDNAKIMSAYNEVSKIIKRLSHRDYFIGGLFLYWAEGGKTERTKLSFTNTDPDMMLFFVQWLRMNGVDNKRLKVKLHIYSDMNPGKQILFWSKILGIPHRQFYKPYTKESKSSSITYKNGFGQGTCSVIYSNRKMTDFVLMGIKKIIECTSKNFLVSAR